MTLARTTVKRELARLTADYGALLPERHHELLRARYTAGISGPRLAAHRGCSKQAVYGRLHRAVRALLAVVPEDDPAHEVLNSHDDTGCAVRGDNGSAHRGA